MTVLPRRSAARLLAASVLALLTLTGTAPAAEAHPLGNFTVNTYNGLRVEPDAVAVRMVVDYAEVPTVQEFPAADEVGDAEASEYAAAQCARLVPGARLQVDESVRELAVESSELVFVPGQAGLPTMRLTCELRTTGPVRTAGHLIEYVDENSLDRVGWREITAVGDGVGLAGSDVPTESVSDELTSYPQDLLSSPLDERAASLQAVPGSGTVTGGTTGPESPSSADSAADGLSVAFTELVASRELGLGFVLVAFAISIGLGALHAFAPGHGKTLMAAYMLGQRKSLRQVAVIGVTVTLTHTTGVLVLGVVLTAVAFTAPAEIYAWLGLASGVLLVAVGAGLLRQARRRGSPVLEQARNNASVTVAHGHDQHGHDQHGHDQHGHDQHGHDQQGSGVTHSHGLGGTHTHAPPPDAVGARGLIAVGFVGGMVPSPSALIVLLGGIALGRAWLGVLLVVAYGIGMALALTATGVALAYARDHVERWVAGRRAGSRWSWALRVSMALPTITAALVVLVGAGLAVRAALTLTAGS